MIKLDGGDRKMAQRLKSLAIKADDLRSIPLTDVVKGKNIFSQMAL